MTAETVPTIEVNKQHISLSYFLFVYEPDIDIATFLFVFVFRWSCILNTGTEKDLVCWIFTAAWVRDGGSLRSVLRPSEAAVGSGHSRAGSSAPALSCDVSPIPSHTATHVSQVRPTTSSDMIRAPATCPPLPSAYPLVCNLSDSYFGVHILEGLTSKSVAQEFLKFSASSTSLAQENTSDSTARYQFFVNDE